MTEAHPLPDPTTEPATMTDALRMWATMPRALWEWGRLLLAYPDEAEALDLAFNELDDAHGKLTQLEVVRILRARMDASVWDPARGRSFPGPHHPLPGENT